MSPICCGPCGLPSRVGRLTTFHHEYAQHLVQREVGSSWRSELNVIIDEHGLHAEVPWYRQSMDGFF